MQQPDPDEPNAPPLALPEVLPTTSAPIPRKQHGDLPDLATRIEEAQRQARARRVEQGLPPDADDGGYALKKPRKHAPKRQKRHGQFLGTVCDSWEATRRR